MTSDIFVNFLLLLIVFMGCYATLVTNIQHTILTTELHYQFGSTIIYVKTRCVIE
ncbi:hypothetical protein ACVQ9Z_02150 [Staphylococcus aureus]